MKAVLIDQFGGREQLREREVPNPVPEATQVVIEIYATSINPIDWKVREGLLTEIVPLQFPIILGWDAAGVITEIGSEVTAYQIGDRVFTRPATTEKGTYAEYTAVDENLLAKIPDNLTFVEAASIPLAGLTAWQCLVDFSNIQKNDKVLIHAGAGGVGSLGIQIAKHFGAYVATTASKENHEFLRSLGADVVIDYKTVDFEQELKDYDIVVDTVGGETQTKSYRVLKEKGKLVSVVEPPNEEEAKRHGVEAGFLWLNENGEQLQELAQLFEKGILKPVVGPIIPFSEKGIKEAHELSESHHAKGKIVIKMK